MPTMPPMLTSMPTFSYSPPNVNVNMVAHHMNRMQNGSMSTSSSGKSSASSGMEYSPIKPEMVNMINNNMNMNTNNKMTTNKYSNYHSIIIFLLLPAMFIDIPRLPLVKPFFQSTSCFIAIAIIYPSFIHRIVVIFRGDRR